VPKSRGGGSRFLDALPEDGERRLMLAVLIDAIRALTAARTPTPRIRTHRAWLHDRAWLVSEDDSTPFSFVRICDALGLDAGYIRRCVLHPSGGGQPLRLRRYAASVEETWLRLQRENAGELRPVAARDVADRPAPVATKAVAAS
jgi:hypothetical protein